MGTTDMLSFDPPGPGSWMLDSTHHGRRPLTRYLQPTYVRAFEEGMPRMFERYGLPLAGAAVRFVHGLVYIRMLGVGEPESSSGKNPPAPVFWALSRLHPELRRRRKTAAAALDERRWRADVEWWFGTGRPGLVERNRTLQAVDLGSLDDEGLLAHLAEVTDHLAESGAAAFANHGGDIVPAGLFIAACEGWGIPAGEAAALFAGSSPAVTENDRLLAPVAAAIKDAGARPATVEEVRALSPEVDRIVARWLDLHGWRLMTSDDLDAPTLAEQPDLQLRALLGAHPQPRVAPAPDPTSVRERVPAEQRARFDELLAEARHGLSQRDDAVGIAWNWPAGLIRRALLEVGRRLVEKGGAREAGHAVELGPDEVVAALAGTGPSADDLAERRAFRDRVEAADPPLHLGPDDEPPPLHVLPGPLATMAAGVMAMIGAMEGSPNGAPNGADRESLTGTGIGAETYRGRACVVGSPVDALDALEPGDVLVAPFTSPSYDSLFPLVGALVTDLGGPLSHTAIMAREFAIPAVVGAGDATATIAHGAIVEVDPVAGEIRMVD